MQDAKAPLHPPPDERGPHSTQAAKKKKQKKKRNANKFASSGHSISRENAGSEPPSAVTLAVSGGDTARIEGASASSLDVGVVDSPKKAAEPAAQSTKKHVGRVLVRIQMDGGRTWTFPQQPKASAYGGMGLARESVFIDMKDEQFQGKFEKVYQQHIDFGSTGKAFIKGFKREREANMLWRVNLREKLAGVPRADPAPSGGKHAREPEFDLGRKGLVKGRAAKAEGPGGAAAAGRAGGDGGDHSWEAEAVSGASGAASAGLTARERVKKRRVKATEELRKAIPKVHVDSSLQQSAIEAYRRIKEKKASDLAADGARGGGGGLGSRVGMPGGSGRGGKSRGSGRSMGDLSRFD